MKTSFLLFLLLAGMLFTCSSQEQTAPRLQIVPAPQEIHFGEGYFLLGPAVHIVVGEADSVRNCAEMLNALVSGMSNYSLKIRSNGHSGNVIRFRLDPKMEGESAERYSLHIASDGIELIAARPVGLFYGVQTLGQILSDGQFYDPLKRNWKLPALRITDWPRFAYRGMHLDVSRHFYSKEFVMKCIDLMAFYKLNRFHWHLTDAAGWRIEIKKYPELTERAAWRAQKDYLDWWKGNRRYAARDSAGAYGGYYTQDEIRDVVAFAASKFVTVIPEIEMPGHSEEVLAVRPELSCYGQPYRNGEFCVGNEKTFEFVENVLTEVLDLFPSEYIHIGGDETSKSAWKKCARCQKRIKDEGLKDEKGLQSYMIRRVGQFLESKGRKLIGWDEILEGGLAPGATVMSWRGEVGGIEAAQSKHDVIMTPGVYCYLDSYQADPTTQPYAIGGFTPYLKTYSYNPVPSQLSAEEAKYILGAQANLWTEYISDPDHVEYMLFPRLLALAEVVWLPEEKKDREDFKYRVGKHIGLLRQKGVNAFQLSDRVDILTEIDTVGKRIKVTFDTEKYQPEIRFTLDGTEPVPGSALYTAPFYVSDSVKVSAALFFGGVRGDEVCSARLDYHKAIGRKVSYKTMYSSSYPAAGNGTLTDGYRGGLTYSDGRWQGFLRDVDVTVDLGKVEELSYVSARFMQLTGPGVYMPQYVTVSVSENGKDFQQVGRVQNDVPTDKKELVLKDFSVHFQAKGRYVRFFAKKYSGFQFIDEIVIY